MCANRLRKATFLLISVAALSVACSTDDSSNSPNSLLAESPVAPASADLVNLAGWPDALNGIWQRRGYGEIHELSERQLTSYAITENSCHLEREHVGIPGIADDALPLIRINERQSDDVEVQLPGYAFPMVLTRLGELPALCDDAIDGVSDEVSDEFSDGVIDSEIIGGVSAREIFTLLWDNFNEYYAFFDERNVDWDALYNEYLVQIDGLDDEDLFALVAELITALDDGHVFISSIEESFSPALEHGVLSELESAFEAAREAARESVSESFETFARALLEQWHDVISRYLDAGSLIRGTQMQWATIDGDTGYILINAMAGYANPNDEITTIVAHEVRQAAAEIDRALNDLADTRQLVIDIRFNDGGFDGVALAIANRFADQRSLAIQKAARTRGQEWGHVEAWFDPVDYPYLYPVTLITGRDTAGAAEVFAVAMRQLRQVTLVGERTNGALSGILFKTLPNGWEFGLSNEVYRDASGLDYEAFGVVPDVDVETFRVADLVRGRDAALDVALDVVAD